MADSILAVVHALANRPEILGLIVLAAIIMKTMKQAQGGRRADQLLWKIGFGLLGVMAAGLVGALFI